MSFRSDFMNCHSKKKIFIFFAFVFLLLFSFSAKVFPSKKVTKITQYGITWTFDQPVVAGQFITGDWWVIGPVKIVKVYPAPGSVDMDTTNIRKNKWNDTSISKDYRMRNGSMIIDKPSAVQGYDSRNSLFDMKESIEFPFILKPNQSLISSESNVQLPAPNFCKEIATPAEQTVNTLLKSAAVLTCLSEIPPNDAFRPPYGGNFKPIFLARNVQWKKLPKLKPVDSIPSWTLYERYFQRPWIDHILSWQQQEIVPNENGPNYGREHARLVSIASLMLMLDVPQKTKEKLTLELIQRGIDLYGLAMAGGYWNEGGGHSSGRKWPILFAGIMLADSTLFKLPPTALFQEDTQTYYGKSWCGQNALWQMIVHHGIRTPYEEKTPESWDFWDNVSESYRKCCTSSAWVGTALAARYMYAVKAWGHNAFFDYVDRWMNYTERGADIQQSSNCPKEEGKAIDNFVTEMWNAYRSSAPLQPVSCRNYKWVWVNDEGKMIPN